MMGRPPTARVKNGSFDFIHVRYRVENNKESKVIMKSNWSHANINKCRNQKGSQMKEETGK
jgi:hypothetical protein